MCDISCGCCHQMHVSQVGIGMLTCATYKGFMELNFKIGDLPIDVESEYIFSTSIIDLE